MRIQSYLPLIYTSHYLISLNEPYSTLSLSSPSPMKKITSPPYSRSKKAEAFQQLNFRKMRTEKQNVLSASCLDLQK